MEQLKLLFTKDGLQYQVLKNKTVSLEQSFFVTEESPTTALADKTDEILALKTYKEISVISALNHFTLMPEGFSQHDLGYDLISYNAPVNKEEIWRAVLLYISKIDLS